MGRHGVDWSGSVGGPCECGREPLWFHRVRGISWLGARCSNCQLLKKGSARCSVIRYDSENEQVRNSFQASLSIRCKLGRPMWMWVTRTDRHFERLSIALSQFDIVLWYLLCIISCVCVRVVCAAYVFNLQNKYLTPYYVNMCHVPTDTKSDRPCPWYRNWLKTLNWSTLLNPWRETPRNWLTVLPRGCVTAVGKAWSLIRSHRYSQAAFYFAEILGFLRSVVEALADPGVCPEMVN